MIQHKEYKEESVVGRYVTMDSLKKKWWSKLKANSIEKIGSSVNGEAIFALTLGTGPHRVLMWSQMHGNESTTTKAVLDLVNFLGSTSPNVSSILKNCTLCIVPILNPDGARAYTRVNANEVDLNRDAKNRTQPESVALRQLFENFKPNFCFNLHDQRTLFSAGSTKKPATISFLSPSNNPERTVDGTRSTAMKLIAAMNGELQKHMPGQVGRYDDGFNENCIGDTFQMLQVPTILFEAGHHPEDYEREVTRKYIFISLLEALTAIAENTIDEVQVDAYFGIPENEKLFYDILIQNPHLVNPNLESNTCIGIQFIETLNNETIDFVPEVVDVGELTGFFGHQTLDCSLQEHWDILDSKNLLPLVLEINN